MIVLILISTVVGFVAPQWTEVGKEFDVVYWLLETEIL